MAERSDSEWLEIAQASDAAHIQKLRDDKRTSDRDIVWKQRQLESEPEADKIKRAKAEDAHAQAQEESRTYKASLKNKKPRAEAAKTSIENSQKPVEQTLTSEQLKSHTSNSSNKDDAEQSQGVEITDAKTARNSDNTEMTDAKAQRAERAAQFEAAMKEITHNHNGRNGR